MAIVQELCPNCGAPVQVPDGATRLQCPYCATSLAVERQGSEVVLEAAGRIRDTLEQTSAQTQAAIQSGTYVTQAELRRLQIAQDLSMAQMRLTQIQSEIRAIERTPQTSVTRAQLRELRAQESALKQQIGALQNILNPAPVSATPNADNGGGGSAIPGNLGRQFFSFGGRAPRSTYWVGVVICFILSLIISAAGGEEPSDAVACISLPAMVLFLWIGLAVSIKRYHDRNKSGWWVLIFLIPIIGPIWQLIELGFLPGTPGANRYG